MTQNFPSYDLVNEAATKLMAAKEDEPVLINGHEVVFDRGWYRVGTDFGDLIYANPADAARFCLCVDVIGNGDTTKKLKEKYTELEQQVEKIENNVRD